MKKIIYVLSIFAVFHVNAQNKSRGAVVGTTTGTTLNPIAPPSVALGTNIEAFRFQPGLVTQQDAGADFTFTNADRWFSLGKLLVGPRTLYGFRVQNFGQGLTMGYSKSTATPVASNPFIEWIGNNAGTIPGNLEFNVATNGSDPLTRKLSFTLRSDLTALFGEIQTFEIPDVGIFIPGTIPAGEIIAVPKVEINSNDRQGLFVNTTNRTVTSSFINKNGGIGGRLTNGTAILATSINAGENTAINSNASNGRFNTGLLSNASNNITNSTNTGLRSTANGTNVISNNYGVFSTAIGSVAGSINCGVYGIATGNVVALTPGVPETIGTYAGYFAGLLYSSSSFTVSDKNLKNNIIPETSNFEKLSKLNPVTYNYIANKDGLKLNLPTELQHGLVAQELEKVYPELVKDLLHPLFNEKNEQIGTKSYKAVNYNGLISIMISSMNEMSTKILKLEETLALKEKTIVVNSNKNFTKLEIESIETNGYFLGQNNPNPFKNSTIIEYSLPVNEKNASILIFNLNGQTLKEYKLLETKGSISIDSTILTKGLYLYSLIVNGQEIATKKMLMN
jgi:Chaperone of endosialidase/Secretion system C-terminal sorting domain